MDIDSKKTFANNSIAKAVMLLNCFSYEKSRLRLKDISSITGISQPTAYRMLVTLKEFNLIDQQDGYYFLGNGLLKFEGIVITSMEVRRISLPYLDDLAKKLEINANLSILDDQEVVSVARVQSPSCAYDYYHIGMRRPIHCTALGKVLVCKSPEIVKEIFRHNPVRYTLNTITDEVRFMKEIEKVRLQGYATDLEEWNNGQNCVATPIVNIAGDIVAAIGLAGPTSTYPYDKIMECVPALLECSNRISTIMKSRGNW